MVLPRRIQDMIAGSERIDVEYKKGFDSKGIKKAMLAFSNARGGTILVGVAEKFAKNGGQRGEPVGLEHRNIEKDKKKIHDSSISHTPFIEYKFNVYKEGSKILYAIEVEESHEKPVCTNSGRYLIRREKGNVAIVPDLIRSIVFSEEDRLTILKEELAFNRREIEEHKDILGKNIDYGYKYPFSKFKMSSLLAFMSGPSFFYRENHRNLEELHHNLTMMNNILDHFSIKAIMAKTDYEVSVDQYLELAKQSKSLMDETTRLINHRIAELYGGSP